MSADLIPFAYDDRQVRTVQIDGEPWFVAADVVVILEIGRVHDAVRGLDEDERGTDTIRTPGGDQQVSIVNESGLYSLILRSRKPEAKKFKRWVTHEVLPAIRKTGRYEAAQISPAELTPRQFAELVIAEADRADRAEAQVLEQAPLVAQAQAHRAGVRDISRQEFAREVAGWAEREHQIKVLHQHVYAFLEHLGLFIKGDRSDHGHATTDAIRRGLAVTEKGTSDSGWNYATGKLTPKGQGHTWDRIARHVEANGSLELPRRIGGAA